MGWGRTPSFVGVCWLFCRLVRLGQSEPTPRSCLDPLLPPRLVFVLCFVYCSQVGVLCNWGSPALGGEGGSVLFVSRLPALLEGTFYR